MCKTQKANQRAFDKALKHIRQQGKAAVDANGLCCYKSESGLSCAFAPMIKQYDEALETYCASDLICDKNGNLYDWVYDIDYRFADQLQSCHDMAFVSADKSGSPFLPIFEEKMQNLAAEYDLEYHA